MRRKIAMLLCVCMVLALCSCGKNDNAGAVNIDNTGTPVSTSESDKSQDPVIIDDSDKSGTEGKNTVGTDKTVTEADTSALEQYNVGGVNFSIPEGYKRKDEYVGMGLTFEALGKSIIRMYYAPGTDSTQITQIKDLGFEEAFDQIADYWDVSFSSIDMNLQESERINKEFVNVGGYQAGRVTYKGRARGDCYREGPIKAASEIVTDAILVHNDVDNMIIFIFVQGKASRQEDVDSDIRKLIEIAKAADSNDNICGKIGDSRIAIGGFSFEIPDVLNNFLNYDYDSVYNEYAYWYGGAEDSGSEDFDNDPTKVGWWMNLYAEREVVTLDEVDELSDEYASAMLESISSNYEGASAVPPEKVIFTLDDVEGRRYSSKIVFEGNEMEVQICVVYNNKSRFINYFYVFYNAADSARAEAFEQFLQSAKNLK